MASVGSPHGGSQAFHPPRMVGGTQGVQGGPGHGQEGRGAGQALRGRDSAPGAVATRAAALRKEPVGAKYMLTAPAPLMAPPGSRNAARCPPPEPPAIAAGCNAAASMAAVPPQDAPPAPQGLPHGRSPRTRRWGPQRHSSQDPSPQPSSSGRAQLVRLDQHPCSPPKSRLCGCPEARGCRDAPT